MKARYNKMMGQLGLDPETKAALLERLTQAQTDKAEQPARKHKAALPGRVLLAACLAVALAVTAWAAVTNLDALHAYFRGDVSHVQDYVEHAVGTVRDDNYAFTVDSVIADERSAYLVVTAQALNDETRNFLLSDDFPSVETFDFKRLDAAAGEDSRPSMHAGSGELSRTEDSVTYAISLSYGVPMETLWVRLGYMEEDLGVEVPLTPVPSVVVEPHITGIGTPQDDDVHTPMPFTVDRVILSPLNCTVETSHHAVTYGCMTVPRLMLRMADGRVLTQAQLLVGTGGGLVEFEKGDWQTDPETVSYAGYIFHYRFTQVQDLSEIKSLILFDMEYPLDGSAPVPAQLPDGLEPFELPAIDQVAEGKGALVPLRALTQALGGTCQEDRESGEMLCTYRDTTLILRPGSTDVTILSPEGEQVLPHGHTVSALEGRLKEYQEPPEWVDGDLAVRADLLFDLWGLDSVCYIARDDLGIALAQTHWLIIP